MSCNTNHISVRHLFSAVAMLLLLGWLTVSTPFVAAAKEQAKTVHCKNKSTQDNPFAGTTEEKTPSSNTFAEEYIHHSEWDCSSLPFQISIAYIHAHESLYKAYHGEPPCPPPNVVS